MVDANGQLQIDNVDFGVICFPTPSAASNILLGGIASEAGKEPFNINITRGVVRAP